MYPSITVQRICRNNGCLNGVSEREEALRVRGIYSVPNKRRMEEVEHSYRMRATEMVSGSTD
jgi:hypothetical protein